MENFLFDAIARLANAGVDFVICGGIACVLHGSDRNSFDLDIRIDMNEENIRKLVTTAKEMNWNPRIPEPLENLLDPIKRKQWIEEKQAYVYTLNSSDNLLQIDIFLTYPLAFEELEKEADVFEIEGIRFKVSSINHLLKAKKLIENKRRQDLYDIDILEELLNEKN